VERISQLISAVRPDEIFLPFRRDGSSEHEAAFRLSALALKQSGHTARVFEFPVWSWWNPRLLLRSFGALGRVTRFRFAGYEFLKQAALARYTSQIEPIPPWTEPVLPPDFVGAFGAAEEFFFEL
jgi:LmbE family N-acetylglucosaminyl deacetylase